MNSKAIKRQLLAAIAMVLVAAIALGSSTYAWFAASGSVQATGMTVTAQAESGILIKVFNDANSSYGTVATSSQGTRTLYPASTANLIDWYHSASTDINSAQAGNDNTAGYTVIGSDVIDQYRFVEKYTIRSATDTPITKAKLQISQVTVTNGSATPSLNQAVRVGVLVSEGGADNCAFYVYAKNTTSTSSDAKGNYFQLQTTYVGSSVSSLKEYTDVGGQGNEDFLLLNNNTIPADDTSLAVQIFVWYEGEDPGCKTTSILNSTTMAVLDPDDISVSVTFKQAPTE